MYKLIFASNNPHKLDEIQAILGNKISVVSMKDAGVGDDIAEYGNTLDENALIKARYIFEKTGEDCFSDDTGLEVEALNNAPGVYSARYAGKEANSEKNINLLLKNLNGAENLKAKFRTVIALIQDGKEFLFEGKIEGEILKERIGNKGFGYDSVFMPENSQKSFAEMTAEEKNTMSHRTRAVMKMCDFLSNEK